MTPLLVGFFSGELPVSVSSEADRIVVEIGDVTQELTRAQAAALRDVLGRAAEDTEEFVRTVGEHRPDGSYVVRRRAADSAGNAKVFDSFGAVEACYDDLPREFTAADVESAGVSGSRRHLLVRYFVEHPDFDCELTCRNPLTARKRPSNRAPTASTEPGPDEAAAGTAEPDGGVAGTDDPGRDDLGELTPLPEP